MPDSQIVRLSSSSKVLVNPAISAATMFKLVQHVPIPASSGKGLVDPPQYTGDPILGV